MGAELLAATVREDEPELVPEMLTGFVPNVTVIPLPEGAEDDGKERGVIFRCLQASLARGFEFVQSQWGNGGNAFRLGEDQDVIVGPHDTQGPAKMTVPGRPPL